MERNKVAYHALSGCPFAAPTLPPAATKALPEGWGGVVAASAEAERQEDAPAGSDAHSSTGWARALHEASKLAPGRLGSLLWIDARCQMSRPPMFALDPWWVGAFAGFYDSKKLIMVCRKGLRAGGSASACRGLARAALFTQRDLDPGTTGVIPIMSATRDEATDRFVTIRAIFRACGIAPARGGDDESSEVAQSGIGGEYRSTKSQAGGGVIQFEDSQGHKLEFRILPALVRHSVGYTGVAGFADESDLWLNDPAVHANPATVVFNRIGERFTTQPEAEFFIFSASYHAKSAHSAKVDEGDNSIQHVSRLGVDGARIDEDSRRWLAAKIKSDDPRLMADGDPASPDIPAWVGNRTKAPIERCYALSGESVGRMLGLYGGRAAENVVRDDGGASAQLDGLAERNRALAAKLRGDTSTTDGGGFRRNENARPGDPRNPLVRGGWERGSI